MKQLTNKTGQLEKELTASKVVARDSFAEAESLRSALSESKKKLGEIQDGLTTRDKGKALIDNIY